MSMYTYPNKTEYDETLLCQSIANCVSALPSSYACLHAYAQTAFQMQNQIAEFFWYVKYYTVKLVPML